MAFTTTQLQALEAAIATGQLEVTYEGITTKYRSIGELKAAYEFVKSKLEEQGTVPARKRVSYSAFEKD
jgi:hypothetical protein